jgi:filamentous hemagglutinin
MMGNVIKIPFDKVFNPVSKQYEWVQTGIWTISKPVSQSSVPSVAANIVDSAVSGATNITTDKIVKEKSK